MQNILKQTKDNRSCLQKCTISLLHPIGQWISVFLASVSSCHTKVYFAVSGCYKPTP